MSLSHPVTFAAGGGKLDRAAHLRAGSDRLLWSESSLVLPLWEGRPLVSMGDGWPRLAWLPPMRELKREAGEPPVFLGLYDDSPRFAADFSHLARERIERRFIAGAKFIELRSVAGEIGPGDATVTATAKGLLGWHATHRFCARCGAPSHMEEGGWRRRCAECDSMHFPRIDPVAIMLVVRGERVLLGRQYEWPDGLYSLLAGYMEPGETIEDTVRRETAEEAGIAVGRVRYLGCQPWPFPSSLMLGCLAEALDEDIAVDTQEIEDAMWVQASELPDILAGKHMRLLAPRADAIARALMSSWVAGDIAPFD
jgi:NAD+ diphosphatase